MKKIVLSIATALIITGSFAQATWKNDKNHSQLKFDITHNSVSTVSGSFTDFEATVTATKADFSDAVFAMSARAESINTGIDARNNHLKTADFFDVNTYPSVTFASTSIKKVSDGKYTLTGTLNMHGISKIITLDLWYRGTITSQMTKKEVTGFRATGMIKRSDFKIGEKFPANAVGDEVMITADGEFGK